MDEVINRPISSGIEVNKDLDETYVDKINYGGFEVVRREFFSHTFEVSVSFRIDSIIFNTATLKKLPNVRYVQFIVNPESLFANANYFGWTKPDLFISSTRKKNWAL